MKHRTDRQFVTVRKPRVFETYEAKSVVRINVLKRQLNNFIKLADEAITTCTANVKSTLSDFEAAGTDTSDSALTLSVLAGLATE